MDKLFIRKARRHLKKSDPVMAVLLDSVVPYAIARPKASRPPYYHTLVKSILNQQLSVKAGRTIVDRLRRLQGGQYFNAQKLHALEDNMLRQCGVSANKMRYIRGLSQAVISGELNFRKITRQEDEIVRQTLIQYPGIGPWSADMFLIQAMGRPDVLPLGDLVLRKSIQRHYRLNDSTDEQTYIRIAEAWRPYRTLASQYLWAAA